MMSNDVKTNDLDVLTSVIAALKTLDTEGQRRVFQAVATFLGIASNSRNAGYSTESDDWLNNGHTPSPGGFSEDRSVSPKQFLLEKQPRTDVDRIACLAYYLTNYRGTPHFKTLDLSALNTEAAQPKFSNAAGAVDNATKAGYLVSATKGQKQLSGAGEQFVQALPDREAAKAVMQNRRPRRRTRKQSVRKAAEPVVS